MVCSDLLVMLTNDRGRVPPPEIASAMYDTIEGQLTMGFRCRLLTCAAAEGLDETGVPQESYVPTAEGGHAPVGSTFPGAGQSVGGDKTVFDAGRQ